MLMPLDDAIATVMDGLGPVADTEIVPLRELSGRVAAADVLARRTQPDFDASAMDGYAIRAADTGNDVSLRVIGESAAGSVFGQTVGAGECVRIFTGAVMPPGADAVVIQEDVIREGDHIRLQAAVAVSRHVRPRGNDFQEGALLVPAGTFLRPASIALAASGGHPGLMVLRRPRVGILATGDELVLPGDVVGPGQIVASNVYGIAAIAEGAGAIVRDLGIVGDRSEWVETAVRDALGSDLDILVTIGGASVGDHDLVAAALHAQGVQLDVMKVAMRPGKPLMAGRFGAKRVLGLPGNPASSLVTSTLFLAPMIRRLAGLSDTIRRVTGYLAGELPANDHRAEFMRARIERTASGWQVEPLPRQDSSLLSIFAQADGLLMRSAHAPAAHMGDACEFMPFD